MDKSKIVSIDAVIDRIKINGYIDCNENDGYYDEYEYDNILHYLEEYKKSKNDIYILLDVINKNVKELDCNDKEFEIIKYYIDKINNKKGDD